MNPDRWTQITNSFSLERGECGESCKETVNTYKYVPNSKEGNLENTQRYKSLNEQTTTRSTKLKHEHCNKTEIVVSNTSAQELKLQTLNSDSSPIYKQLEILKDVIKDKEAKLTAQGNLIIYLQGKTSSDPEPTKITSLYATKRDFLTQTEAFRNGESSKELLLEELLSKMKALEGRFDTVVAYVGKEIARGDVQSDRNSKNPSVHSSCNKVFPKPTRSSTIRENHSRCKRNGIKMNEDFNESEGGSGSELEFRVQFLESLVGQLKDKFMKVLMFQQSKKRER